MTRLLPIALCLLIPACTHIDGQKGTIYLGGDTRKFKADWNGGKLTHVEWDENLHAPVITAATTGIGDLIMKGGAAVMMGKAPGAIQSIVK